MTEYCDLYFGDALGTHIILDFYGCACEQSKLSFVDEMKNVFYDVCDSANLTVVNESFQQFDPYGVSVCLTLAESSMTAHSYPEHNYIAIDLFYCGKNVKAEKGIEVFKSFFKPEQIKIHSFPRGTI
jgi:S-adenosylmethionine decarboxylase